jgi:hypothetical protein
VQNVLGAVALDEARGHRGALARGAHDRHGALRIEAVGQGVDVVPGLEQRAGDVAGVVL